MNHYFITSDLFHRHVFDVSTLFSNKLTTSLQYTKVSTWKGNSRTIKADWNQSINQYWEGTIIYYYKCCPFPAVSTLLAASGITRPLTVSSSLAVRDLQFPGQGRPLVPQAPAGRPSVPCLQLGEGGRRRVREQEGVGREQGELAPGRVPERPGQLE